MKLNVKAEAVAPLEYTFTLSEVEAMVLHALLWAVRGDGAVRDICDEAFELFDRAIPQTDPSAIFPQPISPKQLKMKDLLLLVL